MCEGCRSVLLEDILAHKPNTLGTPALWVHTSSVRADRASPTPPVITPHHTTPPRHSFTPSHATRRSIPRYLFTSTMETSSLSGYTRGYGGGERRVLVREDLGNGREDLGNGEGERIWEMGETI
ncbi:hypothetical protein Pmani_039899 [Petrolisthes manimaculis]|uniref:Uncharacterized protein n=1 Tax=Petrolisthes manimaculis TaxID=1843537 RepID=A0AAE1NBM3_9EUCA|nr:hypothetical protein Pmani_039899 [Petrolisthes manimaculis]